MLQVNQLIGFGVGGGAVTRSFAGATVSVTDLTTYTFAGHALGTAATNRKTVAVFAARAGASRSLSSCTIDGIAATVTTIVTGTTCIAIAVADTPTGTTGDIVPTFSGVMARVAVGVYAMYGASSSTPHASSSSTTDPYANTLDIPGGGVAFGAGADAQSSTSWTWTNLTEDADAAFGAENQAYTFASAEFANQQVGLTITADIATSSLGAAGFASFGP